MRPLVRSLLVAFTAAFAIGAVALPLLADPKVRDHRKKDKEKEKDKPKDDNVRDHRKDPPPKVEIKVTGFAPQTGRVGTQVTISGQGFVKQDKVVLGGRPVKTDAIGDNAIVFTIPARFYDGVISIRHPGAANDVLVGTFTVQADPLIAAFSPLTGPWGTKVEIKGSGFMNGDQVLFNGKALAASELSADRIVVTIPQNATSDFLTVSRAGGVTAKSKKPFTVVLPGAQVTSFAPTSGPPGTKVRLTGTNFGADDKAYYNRKLMQIEAFTATTMDVIVPADARESQLLAVKGPRGEAATSQPFVLVLNPVVTRFNPMWGGAGARVEIFGDHFMQGDAVMFNGKALKIAAFEENRLTVEIPAGATTDTFLVFRGNVQVAAATKPFEVVGVPTVASFTPAGGPAGTRVTILGTGYGAEAKVTYGAQNLRVLTRSETALEVVIPGGATNQPFVVETRGGQATSKTSFQVFVYSVITSVSPVSGPVGARVTIKGNYFNGSDTFFLGTASLAVVERAADSYVVTIPAGAASGKIEWQSWDKRQASRFQFTVVQPPTLAGFAPESGPAGTQVTLTGTNFTNSTAAFYGSLPCTIVRRGLPTTLLVTIPASASGTDYLWVEDGGQRLKSSKTFQVVAPPVISSFSPASAPIGAQVTINGANFTQTSTVLFGTQAATVVKRTLPGQLVVTVPRMPAGAWPIWVEDNGQKVKATASFTVIVLPVIASMSPLSGLAGTKVTVTGENFSPNATVWFGTLSCNVTKRVGKTQLVFEIPATAKGKAVITIDDGGNKVSSTDQFEVLVQPEPPPDGDGTKHHEHAHEHPHKADDHHHHPHAHPHRNGANHHHPY